MFDANKAQTKTGFRRNLFTFAALKKQIISGVYMCMLTNVISYLTVLSYGA
jgi:hypothetical protein